jgi:hypothetical protein
MMSFDEMVESFKDIAENAPGVDGRKFVIYMGEFGMQRFNHQLELDGLKSKLEHFDLGFTNTEKANLMGMLESPDWSNFEIAKIIISNRPIHGSTIQTGEPLLRECRQTGPETLVERDEPRLQVQASLQCNGDVGEELQEQEVQVVRDGTGEDPGGLGR